MRHARHRRSDQGQLAANQAPARTNPGAATGTQAQDLSERSRNDRFRDDDRGAGGDHGSQVSTRRPRSSERSCYALGMQLRPMRRRWRWTVIATLGGAVAIYWLSLWMPSSVSFDWAKSFWAWLTKGESGSSTIRNVGLAILSAPALWLAVMRIRVAYRQVEAIEMGHSHDRFQKGAEMLGGELLAVRLGGIYVLKQLARHNPIPFLSLVVSQYCAFVRHPPEAKDGTTKADLHIRAGASRGLREDVQAIMEAMKGFEHVVGRDLQSLLSGSDLRGAELGGARLSGAFLRTAQLQYANLTEADLSYANLEHADLSYADLCHADLTLANLENAELGGANLKDANLSSASMANAELGGANLKDANLSGAHLRGVVAARGPYHLEDLQVRGLTQDQLDDACANSLEPPDLDRVVGPDGGSLEWRGGDCEKKKR